MKKYKKLGHRMYLHMHDRKIIRNCNIKLKNICRGKVLQGVDGGVFREYCRLWSPLGITPSMLFLNCACSISGKVSPEFIPEDIYYTRVEPALNNRLFALAYNDKNFFERYLHEFREMFPKVYLRGIGGEFYDGDFNPVAISEVNGILQGLEYDKDYILKPATETGAGDNVSVIERRGTLFFIDGSRIELKQLIEILSNVYKVNFILQERIQQCDWFASFNNEATNILRMFTYRSVTSNEIHVLHSYLRYASPQDSFQNYLRNGGYRRGIDKDGRLSDFAISRFGDKTADPKITRIISSDKVPKYNEMVELTKQIGAAFYHHRVLGFDYIVDNNNKVRLLEVNLRNIGMVHHQLIGGPLFGDYTQEVASFCQTNAKSAAFHFYFH
ncbi:MAG: sugar-transfer associated ATP-grasp domain-containing protein [Candidatus Cloacimonetes bacterium]|nr:sugar-transfer associated ATP-grasp domain-containing protein [Candidatus Cloacimonadota bacterium]